MEKSAFIFDARAHWLLNVRTRTYVHLINHIQPYLDHYISFNLKMSEKSNRLQNLKSWSNNNSQDIEDWTIKKNYMYIYVTVEVLTPVRL